MDTVRSLKNTQHIAFEDLEQAIVNGARFVTYQYTISLLAITLLRLTPVYYIPPGVKAGAYRRRANGLSLLFGWWGLPWGPMRTIQGLITNGKGGIDVTRDVMANITRADFEQQKVVVKVIYSPFHAPNKTEQECLRKALSRFMQTYADLNKAYFALYVNTGDPFFVIGLPEKFATDEYTAELKAILYKSFRRNARFEFVNISEQTDSVQKLLELDLKVT